MNTLKKNARVILAALAIIIAMSACDEDPCGVGYYHDSASNSCVAVTNSPVNDPNNAPSQMFWELFGQ